MQFVMTKDLKKGMRLAKPVYNKKGVLLYGRDTKLTEQGIASIKNFDLIGIYILEPAEPLPPMTDDDIEFERFQTMAVFSIKDDMQALLKKNTPANIGRLVDLILVNYGRGTKKISFTQGLRSQADYVYKHALNVAILAALICGRMKINGSMQKEIVTSALLYDIGKLLMPQSIACKDDPDEDEKEMIKRAILDGYSLFDYADIPQSTKRMISQAQREIYKLGSNVYEGKEHIVNDETKILMVADTYDKLTAMKIDESPMSEIAVVRYLMESGQFDRKVVNALTSSINIVVPGVCVELMNGEKGLVIAENKQNLLKPSVLVFNTNMIYNLEDDNDSIRIRDVMKSMDNRIIVDKALLKEYSK